MIGHSLGRMEMRFDIGSQHLGCWGQNTSGIQNEEVYATLYFQAMARNATTLVPWVLCHDLKSCTAVNDAGNDVLCTINDVWMDTPQFDTFPSPASILGIRLT